MFNLTAVLIIWFDVCLWCFTRRGNASSSSERREKIPAGIKTNHELVLKGFLFLPHAVPKLDPKPRFSRLTLSWDCEAEDVTTTDVCSRLSVSSRQRRRWRPVNYCDTNKCTDQSGVKVVVRTNRWTGFRSALSLRPVFFPQLWFLRLHQKEVFFNYFFSPPVTTKPNLNLSVSHRRRQQQL